MTSTLHKLPVVAVIGSGSAHHPNPELAFEVGALVAGKGCHLLTGGGRGVMEDASFGFISVPGRQGLAIGVIPRAASGDGPKPGYPNVYVEVPIFTHLVGADPAAESSRNPINILSACAVVALPGSAGTRAEAALARRVGAPILAVVEEGREAADGGFVDVMREMGVECCLVRRGSGGRSSFDLASVSRFVESAGTRAVGS